MTKIKVFMAFALIVFAMSSCSSNSIQGKWSLANVDYEAMIKTLPAEQQEMMRGQLPKKSDIAGKVKFDFVDAKKLVVTAPDPQTQAVKISKGTYVLNIKMKTLVVSIEKEKAQTFKIIKLDNKSLIVEPVGDDAKGPMMKMEFEKK